MKFNPDSHLFLWWKTASLESNLRWVWRVSGFPIENLDRNFLTSFRHINVSIRPYLLVRDPETWKNKDRIISKLPDTSKQSSRESQRQEEQVEEFSGCSRFQASLSILSSLQQVEVYSNLNYCSNPMKHHKVQLYQDWSGRGRVSWDWTAADCERWLKVLLFLFLRKSRCQFMIHHSSSNSSSPSLSTFR